MTNMKTKTLCSFTAILAVCLFVTSCMTPEQQTVALVALDNMHESGAVTDAQFEVLRETIMSASSSNFWQVLAGNVMSVGMSLLGVRATRGPSATGEERVARKKAKKAKKEKPEAPVAPAPQS